MRLKKKRSTSSKKNLTIWRLSSYLRTLDHLASSGAEIISSSEFEKIEGVTQSLVRRDLSEFGSFGVRGVGYSIPLLRERIAKILGFDRHWRVALVGSGEFSEVLINSESFRKRNLEVVQIFSSSMALAHCAEPHVPVYELAALEQKLDASCVDIVIVAVSPPDVQCIIDRLGRLGIRGVLYFASRPVNVPENMIVMNMDVTVELGLLTHELTNCQ